MNDALIGNNITTLLDRVRLAAQKSQRATQDICVVAASKTRPARDIRAAFECGLRHFGENYLQEALEKMPALTDLDLLWHFIGPIQSNKTRAIAENFDWVHSVERIKIARRLSEQRPQRLPPLQICLQVNISAQASKSGAAPGELPALVEAIRTLPQIQLRGLMAIPAPTSDWGKLAGDFEQLRELLAQLQALAPGMDTLSMGMSNDLELAIAHGSNLIRVGTDIFGPRSG